MIKAPVIFVTLCTAFGAELAENAVERHYENAFFSVLPVQRCVLANYLKTNSIFFTETKTNKLLIFESVNELPLNINLGIKKNKFAVVKSYT